MIRGTWAAESVKRLPSAQAMIRPGLSPRSIFLLSEESASSSPSPHPPPLMHSVSVSQINELNLLKNPTILLKNHVLTSLTSISCGAHAFTNDKPELLF